MYSNILLTKITKLSRLLFSLTIVSYALLGAFSANANDWEQDDITVSGQITADDGEALPGVNILVKGTSNGTITDVDGNYTIQADENGVLVFSYVGFETQEVAINGRSVINVTMVSEADLLSEIVVVGYGTQDKKEITSAVASIDEKDFNRGNVNNPAQLLQGKVAGLSIASPGGDPSGDYTIRLRGLSTFGANTGPLIVIDGVLGADLNSLDPSDIQSMDILKDGSAAAIYGSRGSSGVILVTTKGGTRGTTSVDYNVYTSFESVARTPSVMNGEEFTGVGGIDQGSETDWFDELTRTAFSQVHNFSLSAGSGNTTYRASFNYRDVEGVSINTGFDQIIGRLNITQRAIDDRLALTMNLNMQTRNEELGFEEAFRYATIYNPTAPVLGGPEAGRFGGYWQEILFDYYNPVAILEQNQNDRQRRRLLMNLQADFEIIDGLNFLARYSQQNDNRLQGTFYSSESFFRGSDRNGLATRETEGLDTELFETTLTYRKDIGDLDITGLVGYSYQEFENEGFTATGGNFISNEFGYNNLEAAQDFDNGLGTVDSWKERSKLIAGFGRLNLNYRNTYFLSASIRREGSTRFGENNKWGSFPAVSAGVNISQLISSNIIDDLKLRASYGVTGNLPEDNYLSILRFEPDASFFFENQFVPSYSPASNPNPDLKWERKKEFDIGADFVLFNGQLDGTIDYYVRNTDNGIFNLPVSVPPNLFALQWLNVGKIENRGLELSLGYTMDFGDVTYQPRFNYASYKSELVSLSTDGASFGENGVQKISNLGAPGQNRPIIQVEEGKEVGQLIAWEFDGVNADGTWRFVDQNGDGEIDDADEVIVGNGLPDYEIGFNNSVTWGNFDLNVFFRGTFGHDLLHANRAFYETQEVAVSYNVTNTKHYLPEVTDRAQLSDIHIENASFFKLDNMTLGYNIPIENARYIQNLRVYFSGQNLFTITDYTGVDPEVRYADAPDLGGVLAPGVDRRNTWFATRTYTLGLSVKF